MSVEAVAIVKWIKDAGDGNYPDRLAGVIENEALNTWTNITGGNSSLIDGKVTGNVKNLCAFKLQIGDATWAAFSGDPQIEWAWFHQTAPGATEFDPPIVVDSNRDSTLKNNEFNALVSWLTSNGFDASSLVSTDTRAEIVDKCILIFQQ